ncbi:MAG: hypothetical protein WBK96_04365 [Candidatus Manganitrophaceae bacterium]
MSLLFSIFIFFFWIAPSPGNAELAEQIAATVNGKIVFLSDLWRYQLFFSKKTETGDDLKKILDRAIDHRLLRMEAHRFVFQEPTETEIQQRLKRIRERFKDDGSFQEALRRTGFSAEELKEEIGEDLWVEKLLQERIDSFVFISPKETTRYFQEHAAEFIGKQEGEVEPIIRQILTEEKRREKETEYLTRLRSRATIEINLK